MPSSCQYRKINRYTPGQTTYFAVGRSKTRSTAQATVPRCSHPYASTPSVCPLNFFRWHGFWIDLRRPWSPLEKSVEVVHGNRYFSPLIPIVDTLQERDTPRVVYRTKGGISRILDEWNRAKMGERHEIHVLSVARWDEAATQGIIRRVSAPDNKNGMLDTDCLSRSSPKRARHAMVSQGSDWLPRGSSLSHQLPPPYYSAGKKKKIPRKVDSVRGNSKTQILSKIGERISIFSQYTHNAEIYAQSPKTYFQKERST